jgi:hypothetical protein
MTSTVTRHGEGRRAHTWSSRPLTRVAIAIVVAVSLIVATGDAAAADHGVPCPGERWPSFREVAPSARRIVVGTVVDGGGHDFTLRVEEVLRGIAMERLRVRRVRSGLDVPGCAARWLEGNFGARVAIAFRGRIDGVDRRLTTAAQLIGRPSGHVNAGIERLSLREVRRLAGHAEDGSTLPRDRGIRRRPIELGDIGRITVALGVGVERAVRDAIARQRCEAEIDELPGVVVRPAGARVTTAYGLTGAQMDAYFELRARMGMMARATAAASTWGAIPGTVSVCVVDGALITLGGAPRDILAERAVVFLAHGVRVLGGVAHERRSEFPLLFDMVR